MVILQGEVWWLDYGDPVGSEVGYRRPAVVVQSNAHNRSRIGTIVVVPMTSNMKWAAAPGNVVIAAKESGLDADSVANISLINAADRSRFERRIGAIPKRRLETLMAGIDILLGR